MLKKCGYKEECRNCCRERSSDGVGNTGRFCFFGLQYLRVYGQQVLGQCIYGEFLLIHGCRTCKFQYKKGCPCHNVPREKKRGDWRDGCRHWREGSGDSTP